MLELRTFGGLAIKENGVPLSGAAVQRKTLALLALLAAAGRKGVSRDKLVAYLWPERDADHARHLLKQACYALRHDLSEAELLLGATELRLNPAVISSDVQAFEEALDGGDLAAAVRAYAGRFLDGFYVDGAGDFERWAEAERARLHQRACGALESMAAEATARGDARDAVGWWRHLAELDPLSSRAALGLMTALETAGERAKAIEHGQAHQAFVRAELGVEPASEVLALIDRQNQTANKGRLPRAALQATPGGEVVVTTSPTSVTMPPTLLRRLRRADVLSRVAVAAVGVLLASAVAGYELWRHPPAAAGADVPADRTMLAVLPFENLGAPDEEYFADGLSEAIITRLASIGSLGVIARQSAMPYKRTTKTPRQIGQELGVEYLLTGTVRWDHRGGGTSRVRVTPALVRTSDGAQLWAAQFDTALAGVFVVQSSIAAQVAGALDIALDTPEQQALEEQPTQNLVAYDAYLRGHELLERGWNPVELKGAASMLRRAVALDSSFRRALVELVRADLDLYINYTDQTPVPLREAKTALDRLLRLGPDRPEARWALGAYYLLGEDHDPRRAAEQFLRLARAQPGAPPRGLADASRRAGRWEDAAGYHRRVMRLNPRSPRDVGSAGDTYLELRRFGEAISAFDRVLEVNPQSAGVALDKALAYLGETGDLVGTQRLLPDVSLNIAPTGVEFQVVTLADLVTLLDSRQQAAVLRLTPATLDGDTAGWALARAMLYRVRGQAAPARAYFDSARSVLEARLSRHPDAYGRLRCMLGVALAGLGRAKDAIREGNRVVQIMPVSKDAMEGPLMLANLARIHVLLGEREKAVDQLELVLSRPGPLSANWLKADPFWDSLRASPRFQQLVAARN
jgi:DNA-binding SARP family transcriptional activator/TolB-like protein/Flp pilus assembly protein TadD